MANHFLRNQRLCDVMMWCVCVLQKKGEEV